MCRISGSPPNPQSYLNARARFCRRLCARPRSHLRRLPGRSVCGEVEPVIIDGDIGLYGGFSLRSEYFFGDCEVEDVKTRQDLMTNL